MEEEGKVGMGMGMEMEVALVVVWTNDMTGAGGEQRQRRNPWWKYRGGFSLTPQHHQQFSKSRPFLCLFWFNRSNPLSYLPIKIFQYNLSAHNIAFRVLAPLQNRFSLSRSLIFILSDIDLFVCGMNSTIILPTASSVSSVSVQQYSVLFFFGCLSKNTRAAFCRL